MTTKPDKPVDTKALATAIGKGWTLVDTPKVRAGYKKGEQKLVQADGKTLGMLTLRAKGVRVEGSRLAKNVTVTTQAEVAGARKLLEAVATENERKAKERAAKTPQPTKGSGTTAASAKSAAAETGKRARSRSTAPKASKAA